MTGPSSVTEVIMHAKLKPSCNKNADKWADCIRSLYSPNSQAKHQWVWSDQENNKVHFKILLENTSHKLIQIPFITIIVQLEHTRKQGYK